MEQRGVRMPADKNPAARVERYKERAPEIRFLTLAQIDEQLEALANTPQLQAMVATLIYAGLRREELLWLTLDDLDLDSGPFGVIRVRAKTIDGESWQPKTKVNRALPISRTLRRFFNDYRRRITPGMWLFPSPAGSRWDPDNFSADLRAANAPALVWGYNAR
jgi:integrase